MQKNLILITCLWVGNFLNSQNYVDIFKMQTTTTALNSFDSGPANTRVNEICIDLNVPVKINERTAFLTGVNYESIQVKLFPEDRSSVFGSAALKLGFNRQLSKRLSGTIVFLPKYASDFSSTEFTNVQYGATGFLTFKKRENLSFKAGLYFNSECFGPFFVPMLGLYYLSGNKKFEANIMLPLQADLSYKVHNAMSAGINFSGQIRSYRLNNSVLGTEYAYVQRCTNELFLYLKFSLSKNLNVIAKAGQSFGRSFRVYDQSDKVTITLPATFIGDNRTQLNTDFADGRIFQLTLLYRVGLRK